MKLMKAVILGAVFCGMGTFAAKQPNILFFAVDDMSDWIGPMGYEQAVTPNIDRLAKAGVTFINGHTAGIYCAPSRAAIFSGRYASSTGCYQSALYFKAQPELRPLQQVLQDGGYATYGAGKLFHHPAGMIDMRGWNDFYVRDEKQKTTGWGLDSWKLDDADLIPQPFPVHSKYRQSEGNPTGKSAPWFLEWGKTPNEQENELADTMRTDWAVERLKQKHDKPFFVGVGMYAPHFPNFCPAKYFDLYDRDKIVPPPYKKDDLADLPPAVRKTKTSRGKIHEHLEEIDAVKDAIHGYLACVSYADAMLGRLLDALADGPNANNTIVVLWSDHGYHHGEKMDWGKHTLWERTSNVPFIWAGPGIAKGQKIEASASLIDMFPTLIEFADVKDGQARDGLSLVPILGNPAVAEDRNIFLPGMKPDEYAIMNQHWRYIHYADGTEELYNVKLDPNEWDNLAGNPELVDVKKKLAASAPQSFADPVEPGSFRLVTEGDSFKWVSKKKPAPKKLPKGGEGALMIPRENSDEAEMLIIEIEGREAVTSKVREGKPTYFYFKLNNRKYKNGKMPKVQVQITYLDRGNTGVFVQYDSSDEHANAGGTFKEATRFKVQRSNGWKTAVFNLDDAQFSGRSNGGDLRVAFENPESEPVITEVLVKGR